MDELSAGVYKIWGKHHLGATIELTGTDADQLIQDPQKTAEEFDRQVAAKLNR